MNTKEILNSFENSLNNGEDYALKIFAKIEFIEVSSNLGRLKSFTIKKYKGRTIDIIRDNGKPVICRIGVVGDRVSENFKSIAEAKRAIDNFDNTGELYWYK